MKGDFTRLNFDRKKHYRAVLMQQGRVQLDSDWNEQAQIAEHRYSTFFGDFVGQSGAPSGDSFRIEPKKDAQGKETDTLVIRAGHYYVDGLLVENDEDVILPPFQDGSGTRDGYYLCYLDVWEREVTFGEDPDLLESALGGPDTTVRLRTEWQVRQLFLGDDFPEDGSRPFPESTGKMAIRTGSYGFADNRLYRVEIHDSRSGSMAFKWSRDNASVVAPVATVDDGTVTLTLKSLYLKDAFSGAAFVEVCDLDCTRNCTPGYLGMVDPTRSDLGNGRIAIHNWEGGRKPANALSSTRTNPLIVRRWDGFRSDRVPSPGKASAMFDIEEGLQVYFDSGTYRTGDYWLILMRSGAPANWEEDLARLPDGIEHHYAPLALVEMKDGRIAARPDGLKTVVDKRFLFEPLTGYNVTTTGDVCIGGKLGVGFQDPDRLGGGGVSIAALNGNFVSFQDPAGYEVGRVSHTKIPNQPPSLSGMHPEESNLTIVGNVGMGATQTGVAQLLGRLAQMMPKPAVAVDGDVYATGRILFEERIRVFARAPDNTAIPLSNGVELPTATLREGLRLSLGRDVDPDTVDQSVCFVTVEAPFPVNPSDGRYIPENEVGGFHPVTLAAHVKADSSGNVYWQLSAASKQYLDNLKRIVPSFNSNWYGWHVGQILDSWRYDDDSNSLLHIAKENDSGTAVCTHQDPIGENAVSVSLTTRLDGTFFDNVGKEVGLVFNYISSGDYWMFAYHVQVNQPTFGEPRHGLMATIKQYKSGSLITHGRTYLSGELPGGTTIGDVRLRITQGSGGLVFHASYSTFSFQAPEVPKEILKGSMVGVIISLDGSQKKRTEAKCSGFEIGYSKGIATLIPMPYQPLRARLTLKRGFLQPAAAASSPALGLAAGDFELWFRIGHSPLPYGYGYGDWGIGGQLLVP